MNDRSYFKPILGVGGMLLVALVILGVFRGKDGKVQVDPDQILKVCDIAPNPGRFSGRLRVEGTVSSVYPDQSTFALADIAPPKAADQKPKAKKRNCGRGKSGGCGTPLIPVRYDGALPELHANVLVEGSIITHESGKRYFQAEKITKL